MYADVRSAVSDRAIQSRDPITPVSPSKLFKSLKVRKTFAETRTEVNLIVSTSKRVQGVSPLVNSGLSRDRAGSLQVTLTKC